METRTITCDCGCEVTSMTSTFVGWLELTQKTKLPFGLNIKLRRPFHFASVACLMRWLERAEKFEEEIAKDARTRRLPEPRGELGCREIPDVYI